MDDDGFWRLLIGSPGKIPRRLRRMTQVNGFNTPLAAGGFISGNYSPIYPSESLVYCFCIFLYNLWFAIF